ncbi:MAG TPA: IPT/TIG domain-containing protein [Terriglobales bacterium]|jgi:hypothetical protein|nr:IPT/TIG domain-containing protein [Terriglobales bacterium]
MKTLLKPAALACLLLLSARPLVSQLQQPVAPVNVIFDDDMSISVDDVGNHAVLWGLSDRGEVNVLALICSSANDYSAPTMRAIANYYGHPNVPIGAHKGMTPTLENSANSNYTQQITNQFGTPGDTRANYPDAVTVYRQALANAPDHSVHIVASGYYQPLQALLQSQPDSISPLTGMQLVTQKVKRLVSEAGWFPSGNEHNFRVDADAASFVFANWPVEIVSLGAQMNQDVITGPSSTADPTKDPVKDAWQLFNGGNSVPGFGQVALLFTARGLGTNFIASGLNGQTTVGPTTSQCAGCNGWSQTPNMQQSYLNKQATAAQLEAILNPLLQSSSNMPILRSISPTSVPAGSSQTITLTGTNFFADSQILFNGSSRPTTFLGSTQLSVQLSGSDLANPGTQTLSVSNPEGGGWQSGAQNLTVFTTAPTLTGISPSSAIAGSGPLTLTATGTNFTATSLVQVNGASRSTAFVSSTQLTATLTAGDLANAGSLSITVTSSGGTSAPLIFTVNNPVPSLTSISPSTTFAGGAAFTLTVNGTNFVNGSVVQVNGSSRTTSFVSSTQLSAAIPASDIASAGTLSITVLNPAPGGGASAALSLVVNNPPPSLTSISPSTTFVGGPAFTLTVNGTNFVNGSVVQVNGSSRTTTFVSSTQLTAAIPASDIASAGALSITVVNPAPGGGTSAALTLAVNNPNPAPSLSSILPASVIAGSGGFTLTLSGGNFIAGSVVQVNGSSRSTTFVSSTQLSAAIPASDIASAGTLSITVVNPAPGGGASAALSLVINNPVPTLTSISPSATFTGGAAFTLTVNGTNFVGGSVVQVNGSNRTTTFVSSTQLSAAIPASDIASAGTLSITVVNPGGASGSLTLTVNNPAPSLTSISPSATTVGSPAFTLTVNGSNFVNGSVVQVNGSIRTTTFVSGTQLSAAIPAGDVASVGTLSVSVINPAPGGGASVALSLAVNNPGPSLSSISPAGVTPGSGGFTLTLSGGNFIPGSVVQVNGSSRTTTFVSATQLTAAIPASDVASAGNLSVSVVNPSPGGGTSAALSLAVTNANPLPTLSGLSPDSVIAGSGGFTLTLNGSNFVPSSVVQFNGSNRPTTFVSSTQLTAAIPASDVATAAFPSISVFTPAPGGGIWSLTFAVNNPLPTLSSLSPDSVITGSGGFTLTLNGSNFIPSSVVQFNGSNRPTTFVSSTQLTAAISASDVASASFPSISVVNPGPGGGVWSLTFAVNNPQPTISGISPDSVTAGSSGFTLTISGTNFIPESVVQVNGSSRNTTFVSSTQLSATIPAGDVASAGDLSVSVVNPGPGGGVWAATLGVR